VRRFSGGKNEDYFMKPTWRVLLGFLLAPLITPLTFLLVALVRQGTIPVQAMPIFTFVGFFAYGAAVIFGGPAFLLYWMIRLKNPLWFLIGGGLIGLIVLLLLSLWSGWGDVRQPVTFVVAASLSGLAFRLVAGGAPFERFHSISEKTG